MFIYMRECYSCGRTKISGAWYANKPTGYSLCNNCYYMLFRYNRKRPILNDEERICYGCNSRKTTHGGNYNHKPNWFYNFPTRLVLCTICYNKILRYDYKPPVTDKVLANRRKKFRFKDKVVCIRYIPRIGVCNWCRAVAGIDCYRTALHHIKYDESDPIKYTIEICDSCHGKESYRLKNPVIHISSSLPIIKSLP